MNIRAFATLFVLAIIMLITSITTPAQTSIGDWRTIENIGRKTNLIVETKTGGTIKGKVSSVTSATLNLSSGGKTIALERSNIAKIYKTKKSSRLKRALIGAGIGAAVGVGIGVVYTVATKTNGLAAAGGFLYGLPAGAIIGGLTGGKSRRGALIYESN